MTTEFWGQQELRQEDQAIFWYVFLVSETVEKSSNFLNEFIRSKHFIKFCQPFAVKRFANGDSRFLGKAFNQEVLDISHFEVLSKQKIMDFFVGYSNSPTWGDDRGQFIGLINDFNELFTQEPENNFFFVSKEWFDKEDKILNEDCGIYIYYFLLVWYDAAKMVLNVCEFIYE